MTILDHEPHDVSPQWQATPVQPAYGPTYVSGWDGDENPAARAIVKVEAALSRDELLWALAEQFGNNGETEPDALTIDQTRVMVESQLIMCGDLEINLNAHLVWNDCDEDWDAEDRARMAGLARAIDRAYPPEARTTVVVDGGCRNPQVRCTVGGCGFMVGGRGLGIETLLPLGVRHSEQEHGGQS